MADVKAATEQSFFFPRPCAQQNASRRRGGVVTEGFSQLQQRSGSRTVVVRAIPDLPESFAIVIAVSADDHDFVFQRWIRSFDQPDNVLRGIALALHIDADRTPDARLRRPPL